jgi:hypothetical protein
LIIVVNNKLLFLVNYLKIICYKNLEKSLITF